MAGTKVSDYILQRLREWDVDHVLVKQGLKAKVQEMLPGSRRRDDRPGAGKHDRTEENT
ncbi:hypothetical protein ACFW5X_05935 [Streptomyces albogriseolus]|uniref:hypothetical protein n=1 Tax=Streptomyces albogriseolus TaxID=1887 RepID=UPI0036B3D35F